MSRLFYKVDAAGHVSAQPMSEWEPELGDMVVTSHGEKQVVSIDHKNRLVGVEYGEIVAWVSFDGLVLA